MNSITVIGETNMQPEINEYIVNVEFREIVGDSYRNIKGKTVDDVAKEFAASLSKVNIDFSRFEEDQLYRITSYSYNTSRFYFYKTTSLDEVKLVLSQSMEGVTNTKVDIISKEMTDEEMGKLSKDAIDDARNAATKIAENIGGNIGEIIKIENHNNKQKYFNSMAIKTPIKYYVTVTFSLK
ncbi:SIMPL domain-containing protein [uncultured Aquimarina sp.]|uniref:SIMPL domain-containing protein n=1 Tax=uncultured Aquimarina sp. TaxID=575652 RepID=UPI002630498B|nr:SIMPL domain-containing protein [uncultured Aquimarina sp.]